MPTKAKASKGLVLRRGGNAIAEVTSVSGPNGTLATIDATSHDSTATEFIAGLPDSGEVTFDFNFVGNDAQQQGLETDRVNGTLGAYTLVLNDHAATKTTYTFSAFVTAFGLNPGGVGDKLTGSATLRITGGTTKTYSP